MTETMTPDEAVEWFEDGVGQEYAAIRTYAGDRTLAAVKALVEHARATMSAAEATW